jgi:hypothetical protein
LNLGGLENFEESQKQPTPEPVDVLANHRLKNRANRPPDEDHLRAAAELQTRRTSAEPAASNDDETSDETDNGKHCRSKRNSKSTGIVKPTTMRYYEGTWRAALETCKRAFQQFVVLRNAFPTREEHLDDAHEILKETISSFQSQGRVFDSGTFYFDFLSIEF